MNVFYAAAKASPNILCVLQSAPLKRGPFFGLVFGAAFETISTSSGSAWNLSGFYGRLLSVTLPSAPFVRLFSVLISSARILAASCAIW